MVLLRLSRGIRSYVIAAVFMATQKKHYKGLYMKSIAKRFTVLAVIVLTGLMFAACGLSDAEKELVGKYNLSSITGIPGVSVSSYEYNYIDLKSNGKYELKNKVESTVTEQTGKWSYADGTITFKVSNMSTSVTEEYSVIDGKIVITLSTDGMNVRMEFTREAA